MKLALAAFAMSMSIATVLLAICFDPCGRRPAPVDDLDPPPALETAAEPVLVRAGDALGSDVRQAAGARLAQTELRIVPKRLLVERPALEVGFEIDGRRIALTRIVPEEDGRAEVALPVPPEVERALSTRHTYVYLRVVEPGFQRRGSRVPVPVPGATARLAYDPVEGGTIEGRLRGDSELGALDIEARLEFGRDPPSVELLERTPSGSRRPGFPPGIHIGKWSTASATTILERDGSFLVHYSKPGRYRLLGRVPGKGTAFLEEREYLLMDPPAPVELVVRGPGVLAGTLRDPSGTALRDVQLFAFAADVDVEAFDDTPEPVTTAAWMHARDHERGDGLLRAVTQTDRAGRFRLAGLALGRYRIFGPPSAQLAVSELGKSDYGTGDERIELVSPQHRLVVRLFDERGAIIRAPPADAPWDAARKARAACRRSRVRHRERARRGRRRARGDHPPGTALTGRTDPGSVRPVSGRPWGDAHFPSSAEIVATGSPPV